MDIIYEIQKNQIDYNALKEKCYIRLVDTREVDISIIIPVHGRTQFNRIVCEHFKMAIDYYNSTQENELKISITIVEHYYERQHDALCHGYVNYIHIPQEGRFSKTLCQNCGAFFSNKFKNILLHDVDTVVHPDFFVRLMPNHRRNPDALQCFTKRRLIHAGEEITNRILNYTDHIGNAYNGSRETALAVPGSKGGSIMVSKEMFIKIGGSETSCTEYSIEDAFFWDKIETVGKIISADYPSVEQVHLHHEASFNRVTKDYDFQFYNSFMALSHDDKLRYMDIMSNHIKQFIDAA